MGNRGKMVVSHKFPNNYSGIRKQLSPMPIDKKTKVGHRKLPETFLFVSIPKLQTTTLGFPEREETSFYIVVVG